MKKYTTYKPSGIEWIGDIPEHWEMIKLKYLGKSLIGLSYQPEDIVEDKTQGILVLRSSNIQNGKLSLHDNVYVKSKVKDDIIVKEGDILICSRNGSRSLIGKNITISKELEGNTFGVFMTIFRTPNWSYLSKVFNSMIFTNQSGLFLTSTINQLTQDTLNNFVVPFIHDESEREKIVQFLDEKTEIIDKLISTKESKINLLKEQRTSLINQVITKGLDPNVKMKESGVEWIRDVPEHWGSFGFTKIVKIRHGFQFREYDFTDDGIKVVKITQLDKNGFLNIENCSFIDGRRKEEFRDILINENDILMCLTGGTIGKIIRVGKVEEPLVQNYRVGHFSPLNNSILNDYVFWFMSSNVLTSQIFYEIRETGQPNIGIEDFRKMKILLPPVNEQHQIIKHLETITKEIDDLMSLEHMKIEVLKEYRQSLISEVITGKIDVRTNVN